MLHTARAAIEQCLRRRGFASAGVRRMLSLQILLTLAAIACGALMFRISLWPAAFSVGALIAACNLWWLARSVQRHTGREYTTSLGLIHFLLFIFRFSILALTLYALIARLHLPVIPLAAGLSTVIISLTIWGLSREPGHSFEEA